jgi:DNA-binding MarR family transcriptional regulator
MQWRGSKLTVSLWAARGKLLFPHCATKVSAVAVFKRPFFTTYTTSLWVRFLRFSLQSHKKLEDDLAKLALTPPQFYVLATIGYAGSLPFGEIGAKMMVTVSNLTGIVDRLEEKKLVVRKRDDKDRRVVHVILTEKGDKLYRSTIPLFEKSVAQVFAGLPKSEQKELSAILRKLNQPPAVH